ncbi:Na+/H+ antiporter NhaC [Peptoniphilus sp. ING2-D1G]|nr:Na+/H+ antiporter NhaC [Peptoniphilus sp. ING2-D1G]
MNEKNVKKREKREITTAESAIMLFVVVVVILLNAVVFKIGTGLSVLIVAMIVSVYAMFALSIPWDDILAEILKVFDIGMGAVLILMMVGFISASWTASGTTPMLIYYGLELVSPGVFLIVAYLLCLVLGMATGSAWAIIASVGVALMGVGQGLEVPFAPTAAAIAGGAYVGDMWSPFSDITNLNAATTRGNSFGVTKALVPIMVPAVIIATIAYGVIGMGHGSASFDNTGILEIQEALNSAYNWNILLLIPPIIVIFGSIKQWPIIPIITLSALVSVLFAIIFQGADPVPAINVLYNGVVSNTGNEAIDKLLSGGGLQNMMGLLLTIFCAFIFAGALESTGMLQKLMGKVSKRFTNPGMIILASLISLVLSAYLVSSIYVATIVNARIWKDVYTNNGMSSTMLARTSAGGMSNWGIIVPWSGGVVVMNTTFGVEWYQYAPFLFTTWLSMILILVYGFTNKFMIPLSEEEKEEIRLTENTQ